MAFPSFASGDVLTATDMNAVGLWLVKTQTVGTGVASVTVTNAFSSTYDNYRIIYTGGTMSASALIEVYMGAAPAGTAYQSARVSYSVLGAANAIGDNNKDRWFYGGVGGTAYAFCAFDLYNPFLTQKTFFHSQYVEFLASSAFGTTTGLLDNSTSYSSFTLDGNGAATMTGGTIRVYGYRN